MKRFNLDEYLKDPNREIITRDGDSVRIICKKLSDGSKRNIQGRLSKRA